MAGGPLLAAAAAFKEPNEGEFVAGLVAALLMQARDRVGASQLGNLIVGRRRLQLEPAAAVSEDG